MLFKEDMCFIPGNNIVFLSCLAEVRRSRRNHLTMEERLKTNTLIMI